MEDFHKPVLLREVLDRLDIRVNAWYLDATLGDGGHSLGILEKGGNIVGIDVDPEAIKRAGVRLGKIAQLDRFKLLSGNFRNLKDLVGDKKFAGVLFDLGVSSLQLEDPKRGFSFLKDGPLDMRMDPTLEVKALDLINGLNKGELYELFTKLGEEKNAFRIVDALVSSREVNPIQTTTQLAGIIERSARRRGKIHPATKIFQALRIAVNDEQNALHGALPEALEVLEENGKIIVISFHSLEDRIVKVRFKEWEALNFGVVYTKKPITPSNDEIKNNPRSRSAKMRVFVC